MKKIYVIGAFAALFATIVSCNKEQSNAIEDVNEPMKIVATYEQPDLSGSTKVSVSEGATNFSLVWDGGESLTVVNSVSTNTNSEWSTTDSGSTTATFTGGELPGVGSYEGTTVNYIGIVSSFASASANNARGAIKIEQTYDPANPTSIARNSFLVAREDGCEIGTLNSLSFKTMNSFLKFSLKKGEPAIGSSNVYANMYVKSIVVEAINEEYIAGRFGVSKTAADWSSAYAEEVTGQVSKTVTLDCTSGSTTKGVALGTTATDFYLAIAFKTYAKGLKVSINVQNDDDDQGQMVGYISKNASITIPRNKMIRMPELSVSPEDVASEIICWSENWTGGAADATPQAYLEATHSGTVVYNNATITYSQSTNATKLYAESLAGGASPELMLRKKENSKNGVWTISDIPTAGAATLSLKYKCNNDKPVVTCSTTGVTVSGDKKDYTITTNGATKITLVFTNTSTSNSRIDDIVLKVIN